MSITSVSTVDGTQTERRDEVLKALGLSKTPDPRMEMPEEHPIPVGSAMLNFKKALQLVDPLETAAFERFIPNHIVIDQSLDARAFHPEASKCITFRTDLPIPSNRRVFSSTGIGTEQNAQNQYLWLSQELERHWTELGARAMAPPLLFRTNGSDGTVPLLGLMMKLDLRPSDDVGKANWGLLGHRMNKIELDEDETL